MLKLNPVRSMALSVCGLLSLIWLSSTVGAAELKKPKHAHIHGQITYVDTQLFTVTFTNEDGDTLTLNVTPTTAITVNGSHGETIYELSDALSAALAERVPMYGHAYYKNAGLEAIRIVAEYEVETP